MEGEIATPNNEAAEDLMEVAEEDPVEETDEEAEEDLEENQIEERTVQILRSKSTTTLEEILLLINICQILSLC